MSFCMLTTALIPTLALCVCFFFFLNLLLSQSYVIDLQTLLLAGVAIAKT
jgi:hypothetical protein